MYLTQIFRRHFIGSQLNQEQMCALNAIWLFLFHSAGSGGTEFRAFLVLAKYSTSPSPRPLHLKLMVIAGQWSLGPALMRQRQADLCEFQDSQKYT